MTHDNWNSNVSLLTFCEKNLYKKDEHFASIQFATMLAQVKFSGPWVRSCNNYVKYIFLGL